MAPKKGSASTDKKAKGKATNDDGEDKQNKVLLVVWEVLSSTVLMAIRERWLEACYGGQRPTYSMRETLEGN